MKINVNILLFGLILFNNSCDKSEDEIIDTNDTAITYSSIGINAVMASVAPTIFAWEDLPNQQDLLLTRMGWT